MPVAGQTSDEELKASIMKEFFPEEMKREEFENNNVLIAEVWLMFIVITLSFNKWCIFLYIATIYIFSYSLTVFLDSS